MSEKHTLTCEAIARKVLGEPAKQERDELYWLCPCHEDHDPSLKINRAKNVWFCGPCGKDGNWFQFAAFLARLNPDDKPAVNSWLKEKGFELQGGSKAMPEKNKPKARAEIIREHIYALSDGTPVARKLRWGSHDPAQDKKLKSFSWQRWENNAWVNGLSSQAQCALPFYRSNLSAEAGSSLECPIVLTEGEHDADAGASIGFHTTTVGGTGTFRQQHADYMRARHVLIVAHSDAQGQAEAEKRAALLYPVAASVRVVSFGGIKDLAEAIEGGMPREIITALFDDATPWHPATGAEILHRAVDKIMEYIDCPVSVAVFCAVWAAHTHAIDACDYTPYLSITAPTMRCGKTHLMRIVGFMSARSMMASSISSAAAYRSMEKWHPTLFIDEVDKALRAGSEAAEVLLQILTTGNERGVKAIRAVGQGANMDVAEFDPFGAKGFTSIKRLPDELKDRSITIELERAKPEKIKHFRVSVIARECQPIGASLAAWIQPQISELRNARPENPFTGRDADILELLLSIADAAGEDVPDLFRKACKALLSIKIEAEDQIGIRLLTDIKTVFDEMEIESLFPDEEHKIKSMLLCERLAQMEDHPWVDILRGERPINPAVLARMLKPFHVQAEHKRVGTETHPQRVYLRSQFEKLWSVYVPAV